MPGVVGVSHASQALNCDSGILTREVVPGNRVLEVALVETFRMPLSQKEQRDIACASVANVEVVASVDLFHQRVLLLNKAID
jgi:hypothetical protein